ncbi:MAG: ribonuclease HI family protein [bacterium]
MVKYHLYTDGGARGNPGPAAAGVVVCDDKLAVLRQVSKFLGIATNNQAEYQALIFGLGLIAKLAKGSLGSVEVRALLDSELVVRHLTGEYRVKDANLRVLFDEVNRLSLKFGKVSFFHIRREQNKKADLLVNLELDKHSR